MFDEIIKSNVFQEEKNLRKRFTEKGETEMEKITLGFNMLKIH